MKKILTFLMMFAMTAGILSAQTTVDQPTADQQGPTLSYQLVVRDANNNLVVNKEVDVEVRIESAVNGTADNPSYYENFEALRTNHNGMLSLTLGGEGRDGSLTAVNWANANIFITVTETGSNQVFMQFNEPVYAVPYALQSGFLLTTQQIVDYVAVGSGHGSEDVKAIVAALRGNQPFLTAIRDTVVEYVKNHFDISKQVIRYYLHTVSGADVREAYDHVMAIDQNVRNEIVNCVKDYLKRHRSMAVELAKYYLRTTNADEIDALYRKLFANTAVYNFATEKVDAVLDDYLRTIGLDPQCLADNNFGTLCDLQAAAANMNYDPNDTCPRITSVANTANDGLVALYLNQGIIMTAYVKNYDPNKVSSFGFKLNNDNTIRPAHYIELSNNFGKFVDTLNETEYCRQNVTATAVLETNDCVVDGMTIETQKTMTYTVPGYVFDIQKDGNILKLVFTPDEARQFFASQRPDNIQWFVDNENTPRATGLTFNLPDTWNKVRAHAYLRNCTFDAEILNQ